MKLKKGKKRGKYTGEKIEERRLRQAARQQHIQAIKSGKYIEELPEALVPEIFNDIKETYWERLKLIPDPRNPERRVYPLYLILHRIISGFIEGNKYIGVLFPKKRIKVEAGKKQLGGLPTRKVVYGLLRRIDWTEANEILAPLWRRLGFTPDLVVRRKFRNPREVLDEFRDEQESEALAKIKKLAAEREAEERSKGMSAAQAKRAGVVKVKKHNVSKDLAVKGCQAPCRPPIVMQHDLVIDGKVVKASYNGGVKERFVHVTEIRQDENENRSRFIIGAYPTELDRNGEWGAAVSVLDALTPLSGDRAIIVSGDAGFCVEEFCEWLNEKSFFLPFPSKGKCR